MALWYEVASLPLKSVMKTLQSLPIESENGRDRNDLRNHSEPDFYTEVKNLVPNSSYENFLFKTKEIFLIQVLI